MQKCSNCSAPLQDLVEQCTFCGTMTDRGVQARQARALQNDTERRAAEQAAAQRQAADLARSRASAQLDVENSGKWALIASLVGSFVCCLVPVGPVLGVVLGLRSRRMAEQHGLPGAALGTAGLTFGVIGLSLSVLMWLGVGAVAAQEHRHRGELQSRLGNLTDVKLELPAACALTELEMLDTHYAEFSALDDFDCTTAGDLEVRGEEAVLRNLHFVNGKKKVELFACLRYRNRWTVAQLRANEDCSASKEE